MKVRGWLVAYGEEAGSLVIQESRAVAQLQDDCVISTLTAK